MVDVRWKTQLIQGIGRDIYRGILAKVEVGVKQEMSTQQGVYTY
jgi:hypothetical protein